MKTSLHTIQAQNIFPFPFLNPFNLSGNTLNLSLIYFIPKPSPSTLPSYFQKLVPFFSVAPCQYSVSAKVGGAKGVRQAKRYHTGLISFLECLGSAELSVSFSNRALKEKEFLR